MTPEDAFLQDVRERPDDDGVRLIFADWLEDHGQADRADFIRAGIDAARLAGTDAAGEAAALGRARRLLATHWPRWGEPIERLLGVRLDERRTGRTTDPLRLFSRGFVERAELDAPRLVEAAPEAFARWPLRVLSLYQVGDAAARLAALPQLAWVEELHFVDFYRAPLDPPSASCLARLARLDRLRLLWADRNYLGDGGARFLADAPWLGRLESLSLMDNGLSWEGAAALATTGRAFRPAALLLDDNEIGDRGAAELARSPILGRVAGLSLRWCGIGAEGVEALQASPHLPAGAKVMLEGNPGWGG